MGRTEYAIAAPGNTLENYANLIIEPKREARVQHAGTVSRTKNVVLYCSCTLAPHGTTAKLLWAKRASQLYSGWLVATPLLA